MNKPVQELSSFFSESGNKRAVIYRVLNEESTFCVSAMSETGTSYSVDFSSLTKAEEYAEDWVLDD